MIWRPDHCGCQLHVKINPDGSLSGLTQTEDALLSGKPQSQPTVWCAAHQGLAEGQPHLAVVWPENQRKNIAFRVLERIGVTYDQYQWSFDQNRRLRVTLVGRILTLAERAAIRAALVDEGIDALTTLA